MIPNPRPTNFHELVESLRACFPERKITFHQDDDHEYRLYLDDHPTKFRCNTANLNILKEAYGLNGWAEIFETLKYGVDKQLGRVLEVASLDDDEREEA